jgi:hypothetical protein
MKWLVNDPVGNATNLRARTGANLTLVNQGGSAVIAIGALTEVGNVCTFVLTTDIPGLAAGQAITIAGVVAAGYNGSFICTAYNHATLTGTYTNPTAGLGNSTGAGTLTQGCDVYLDTSGAGARLNGSAPGNVPDGTRIAAGGGQVQFTSAPVIFLRAAVQTVIEVQP